MSAIADKLVEILSFKFDLDLLEKTKFFDKPESLELLNKTVLEKLQNFLKDLRANIEDFFGDILDPDNLKEVKNWLKENEVTNNILTAADEALNEEILSELLLNCERLARGDTEQDIIDSIQQTIDDIKIDENFIDNLEEINDFITKISAQATDFLNNALESSLVYAAMALMLFYIIKLLIQTFTNTDFPSIFRLKYIGKLIREMAKGIWNVPGVIWDNFRDVLKKLDAISVAMALATISYLYFLKKSQDEAEEALVEDDCPVLADALAEVDEPSEDGLYETDTEALGFNIPLECPVQSVEELLVPHNPYLEQFDLEEVCRIIQAADADAADASLNGESSNEIAVNAIIENRSEDEMIPIVSIDSEVNVETVIATLGDHSVYAPTNGYITSLQPNLITLSDISDPPEDYLTQSINSLNEKYTEMNYIKMFLKEWNVVSLFPVMMANSPITDGEYTAQEIASKKYDNMYKRFEAIKKDWAKEKEIYDKKVKETAGAPNVQTHCENDTIIQIKEELDAAEDSVNKWLRKINTDAISIAKITKPKSEEFELAEYFLVELATGLNSINVVKNEDGEIVQPSKYEVAYRDQINIFLNQRYIIDGWKPEKVEDKIKELLKDLRKGLTPSAQKLFETGVEKYNKNKKMSDVIDWLENIENPKKLESFEKEQLVSKLTFLYEFYFNIEAYTEKYKDLKEADNREQVVTEGNYISNFFDTLWKRHDELPKEIAEIEKIISDLSIFVPYTLENDPSTGIQSRYYLIPGKTSECPVPTENGEYTEAGFDDIRYWLRYCSFATLASVFNPVKSWSTGWLGPPKPIKFPTVYIPITPIQTQYGFIVLGLTITGIWIFPMILLVNYSTEYALPILDPTGFLKKQIEELKKLITKQLRNLKTSTLKTYVDKKKEEVKAKKEEVKAATKAIKEHKKIRPAKTKKNREETIKWQAELAKLEVPEEKLKLELFKLEQQYQIVNDAYISGAQTKDSDVADQQLKRIQDTEESINNNFDKLDGTLDKINNIVAPLPTTLQPNTTNFGFTLKNPLPVINIAEDIDENINQGAIDDVTDKYKVDNEDFMKKTAKFEYKEYLTAISLIPVTGLSFKDIISGNLNIGGAVTQDPYPSYENLKLKNLPWLVFLATDFAPKGAKTYGFPGQLPLPT